MNSEIDKKTPGRKRDEATRNAILKAAFDVIDEVGYRGFTIEGVAARSGAGKTTIYRWWPTKEDLAFDALVSQFGDGHEGAKPESVIEGIRMYMRRLAASFAGKPGRVLASIVGGSQCQADAAERFRERFLAPRREKGRLALQHGIATGELRPDIDIDAALDALISPFFFRLLWRIGPCDTEWADRVSDQLIRGLAARAADGRTAETRTDPALATAETHAAV